MNSAEDEILARKVRWRCNRGMLELDLLLIPFAEQKFCSLSTELKDKFIKLLTFDDPVLYGWLMGFEEVTQPELVDIIDLIKKSKY